MPEDLPGFEPSTQLAPTRDAPPLAPSASMPPSPAAPPVTAQPSPAQFSSPGGAGWGIREPRPAPPGIPAPVPTPNFGAADLGTNRAAAPYGAPATMDAPIGAPPGMGDGGAPPGVPGNSWPAPAHRRSSSGTRGTRAAGSILLGLGLIAFKVFGVFGASHAIRVATAPTYHVPASIGGVAQTSGSQIDGHVAHLKDGFDLPSLQGSHADAAAYGSSPAAVVYEFAFGQDNSGHNVQRKGMSLTEITHNMQAATIVTSTAGGSTIQCGTASDAKGAYQVCIWYSSNAFGEFMDSLSTTPSQAAVTLGPTLQAMMA